MNTSERYRNARASLMTWCTALTITGTPKMLGQDQPVTVGSAAIRWSVEPVSSSMVAVDSAGDHTMRRKVLLIADLFWPAPSDDGTVGVYDMDEATDDVIDAMTLISLRLKDYAIPAVPVDLPFAHQLRSLGPPQHLRPGTVDGYTRARVTALVEWDAYHTA